MSICINSSHSVGIGIIGYLDLIEGMHFISKSTAEELRKCAPNIDFQQKAVVAASVVLAGSSDVFAAFSSDAIFDPPPELGRRERIVLGLHHVVWWLHDVTDKERAPV